MSHTESEVTKLQAEQRAAVSRAVKAGKDRQENGGDAHLHPDLQDLDFGPLGAEQRGLPPPLRPSLPEDDDEDSWDHRGSLSDFSDYEDESDDVGRSQRKPQDRVTVSDNDDERSTIHHASGSGQKLVDVDDPFADPFAG